MERLVCYKLRRHQHKTRENSTLFIVRAAELRGGAAGVLAVRSGKLLKPAEATHDFTAMPTIKPTEPKERNFVGKCRGSASALRGCGD